MSKGSIKTWHSEQEVVTFCSGSNYAGKCSTFHCSCPNTCLVKMFTKPGVLLVGILVQCMHSLPIMIYVQWMGFCHYEFLYSALCQDRDLWSWILSPSFKPYVHYIRDGLQSGVFYHLIYLPPPFPLFVLPPGYMWVSPGLVKPAFSACLLKKQKAAKCIRISQLWKFHFTKLISLYLFFIKFNYIFTDELD